MVLLPIICKQSWRGPGQVEMSGRCLPCSQQCKPTPSSQPPRTACMLGQSSGSPCSIVIVLLFVFVDQLINTPIPTHRVSLYSSATKCSFHHCPTAHWGVESSILGSFTFMLRSKRGLSKALVKELRCELSSRTRGTTYRIFISYLSLKSRHRSRQQDMVLYRETYTKSFIKKNFKIITMLFSFPIL